MKILLLIVGTILTISSLYYFARLIYLLLNAYEFTNYGLGILVGRFILLIVGVLLFYLGIRKRK